LQEPGTLVIKEIFGEMFSVRGVDMEKISRYVPPLIFSPRTTNVGVTKEK
jgi:hypothetical protein